MTDKESSQEEVFDTQYRTYGSGAQRSYPNDALIRELAIRFFRKSPKERSEIRILEIGCGSGANLWMVAREGFDTTGSDFSSEGLKYCEETMDHWGVKAHLVHADMMSLPFEDNSFDYVFEIMAMQHLDFEQHKVALSEVERILKDGGEFFSYHVSENSISFLATEERVDHCTVPNVADGLPLSNNGQMSFLSANEARRLLMDCGLEPGEIDREIRSYDGQKVSVEYLLIRAKKTKGERPEKR